jgi:hypothetical protein
MVTPENIAPIGLATPAIPVPATPDMTLPVDPAIPVDAGIAAPDLAQQPPVDEYKFKLPTGEVFRTEAELEAAKVEATYTIQRQKAENELLKQMLNGNRQQTPQQPQVDPAQRFIEQTVQELVGEGFDAEAAKVLAKREWKQHQALTSSMQQQQQAALEQSYIQVNPILRTDFAVQVRQQHQMSTGRDFATVQDHHNAVLIEGFRNGLITADQLAGGMAASMRPAATAPDPRAAVAARMQAQNGALRQPTGGAQPSAGVQPQGDPLKMAQAQAAYQQWLGIGSNAQKPEADKLRIWNTMKGTVA